MPIFKSTPARITEPAVGACTWASGSQVCSGTMGTLMAKLSAKAASSQVCVGSGRRDCNKSAMANEVMPPAPCSETTSTISAASIKMLPRAV